MKKKLFISAIAAILIAFAGPVKAGVPLNNLEGVGGIAFNPLAYPAGQNAKDSKVSQRLSNPQFGGWYVKLSKAHVDWTADGAAVTFGKRVEASYGYEVIAVNNGPNVHKNNLGAKFLILPENNGGNKAIPAISIGTIWKHTSLDPGVGKKKTGFDVYAVATKLITETPKPILLSGGLLDTSELVTGVFGFDSKRKLTFFGNADVLPLSNLAVGLEYKQGAKFSDFNNASYWDAHAAWFVNKNVTIVGAYVNAGNINSTTKVGLGNGFVLSAHYAF